MASITQELREERGRRLKELLKDHGMSQAGLVNKLKEELSVKVSPQFINDMVKGRKTLTESTAQDVTKIFPEYRIQWLLGFDEYKTEEAAKEALLKRIADDSLNLQSAFKFLLQLMGWTVLSAPINGSIENKYIIENKDGKTYSIEAPDFIIFVQEILGYIDFRLDFLIKSIILKNGWPNGANTISGVPWPTEESR